MKIALITNPHTGGGKALKLLPQIEKRLKTCAIDFELFKTKYHGHTMEIVKNIALSEYDAIVSMGGDGTNYHVLNSVIKYHGDKGIPPLGIAKTTGLSSNCMVESSSSASRAPACRRLRNIGFLGRKRSIIKPSRTHLKDEYDHSFRLTRNIGN